MVKVSSYNGALGCKVTEKSVPVKPGAPASSIITDNLHNGFQISPDDSMNLTGMISDLFDIFMMK